MAYFAVLTKRENEVVTFVVQGHSNKQMARLMHISPRTVEDHRAAAYTKLNVHNSIELIRKVYGIGREQ